MISQYFFFSAFMCAGNYWTQSEEKNEIRVSKAFSASSNDLCGEHMNALAELIEQMLTITVYSRAPLHGHRDAHRDQE